MILQVPTSSFSGGLEEFFVDRFRVATNIGMYKMYKERSSLEQFVQAIFKAMGISGIFPDPKMRSNNLEFFLVNPQSITDL